MLNEAIESNITLRLNESKTRIKSVSCNEARHSI